MPTNDIPQLPVLDPSAYPAIAAARAEAGQALEELRQARAALAGEGADIPRAEAAKRAAADAELDGGAPAASAIAKLEAEICAARARVEARRRREAAAIEKARAAAAAVTSAEHDAATDFVKRYKAAYQRRLAHMAELQERLRALEDEIRTLQVENFFTQEALKVAGAWGFGDLVAELRVGKHAAALEREIAQSKVPVIVDLTGRSIAGSSV